MCVWGWVIREITVAVLMAVLLALISVSTLVRECFRDQRMRVSPPKSPSHCTIDRLAIHRLVKLVNG